MQTRKTTFKTPHVENKRADVKNLLYYFHGLCFSTFASVSIYMTYQDAQIFAAPNSIWRSVIFSILFYVVFIVILYIITKDHETTGIAGTFMVLGMLYIWRTFILITIAIALAWLLLGIVGKKFSLIHFHISASAIALAIAAYHGVQYLGYINGLEWGEKDVMASPLPIESASVSDENKPDIYYIILDGYGGANMLRSLHGFDNSKFIADLESRGFIVTPESKANYPRTILSLGSSLNAQYLDNLSSTMGNTYLWWPLTATLSDSQVRNFLEGQGYQTIVIASGWDFTSIADADVYKKPYPIFLNKFEELFIQNTNLSVLSFLSNFGISFPSYPTHRTTVTYQFDQLTRLADLPSPKFVFVHIISPHAPFIFDAEGNPVTPDYPFTFADDRYFLFPASKYRQGYLAQLLYVNNQVIRVVDSILSSSRKPPVIILQGDHGPGVFIDYRSSENSCLYERFSILNAFYFPGVAPESVPADISPVNTFRLILNNYFSTNLELLPNRYLFSPSYKLYQFEDISDKVDQPCKIPDSDKP